LPELPGQVGVHRLPPVWLSSACCQGCSSSSNAHTLACQGLGV
jgi:hypothetical protein